VASHLHCLSSPAVCFAALAVSFCCLICLQFRRYRLVASACREPRPPCCHGR
jgi:hypothetical protein